MARARQGSSSDGDGGIEDKPDPSESPTPHRYLRRTSSSLNQARDALASPARALATVRRQDRRRQRRGVLTRCASVMDPPPRTLRRLITHAKRASSATRTTINPATSNCTATIGYMLHYLATGPHSVLLRPARERLEPLTEDPAEACVSDRPSPARPSPTGLDMRTLAFVKFSRFACRLRAATRCRVRRSGTIRMAGGRDGCARPCVADSCASVTAVESGSTFSRRAAA